MSEKKPRLFYFEEGESCWFPAPEEVAGILDATSHFSRHGETVEIRFKRLDLTDEEMDALPDRYRIYSGAHQ